jgi:hypothetical protein
MILKETVLEGSLCEVYEIYVCVKHSRNRRMVTQCQRLTSSPSEHFFFVTWRHLV